MSTLRFNHSGWDVMTSAWSAGSNTQDRVEIRYVWREDPSTLTLRMSMDEFARQVARQGLVVDCRPYQEKTA